MVDHPPTMDETRLQQLAEMLDQQTAWPTEYQFKFIVPAGAADQVAGLFADSELKTRESRTGKYVSVSATQTVASSAEVIAVYRRAAQIQGLIAL